MNWLIVLAVWAGLILGCFAAWVLLVEIGIRMRRRKTQLQVERWRARLRHPSHPQQGAPDDP